MRVHSQRVSKTTAILGALCVAVATLWSSAGKAADAGLSPARPVQVFSTGSIRWRTISAVKA